MRTFVLVSALAYLASANDINVCSDAKSGMFLQDFTDPSCSSYIVCMNSVAFAGNKCDSGFLFNGTTQSCNYASETKCNLCPAKSGVAVYNRAYPGLCGKYILCYGSTPVVRQCGPGLQYDAKQERCNDAALVDCVANKCDAADDPDDITFVASANSCSKYFICFNGQPQPMDCGSKLNYNPETSQCDLPANYACPASKTARTRVPYSKQPPQVARNVVCPKTQGVHFLPNPSDSSSYIVCGEGRAYYMTCAYGLVYDTDAEECRKP